MTVNKLRKARKAIALTDDRALQKRHRFALASHYKILKFVLLLSRRH